MTIYLIRHGKSDKSLKESLPHNEFELKRALLPEAVEKARQLGITLQNEIDLQARVDLVFSGRLRSRQTVLAIAEGLGLSTTEAQNKLREDFGLAYLADEHYWETAEQAIQKGEIASHADFFLTHPSPNPLTTFSAESLRQNMRAVLRRAMERNTFLGNQTIIMVSHEPVISLCLSDLTQTSVTKLGGACQELEYATFELTADSDSPSAPVRLSYRQRNYSFTF